MIRKMSNGRYYVTTHYTDPATGKRRQRSHGGYRTKAEAKQVETDVLSKIDQGTYVVASKRTVGSYLTDEWLPSKLTQIRPSTHHSYTRLIDLHVTPKLGQLALQDITAPMLNAYYADLLASGRSDGQGGLSARTVAYIHTVLGMALKDAVGWGYVQRNVADQAKPPRQDKAVTKTHVTWQPAQVTAFLDHVADDRLYVAYRLAALTGMRRGEVLGLRWQDLDLDARQLHVRQQLTTTDYVLAFGPPKTGKGQRTVPLDPATITALKAHRKRQAEDQLLMGAHWQNDQGLVFANADGTPVHPNTFAQAFTRHLKASGLPRIKFHDLRHTWATNALLAGVAPKVVSDILGHATVAFTMDTYTHSIPQMQADAVDLVANLYGGL